MSEPATMASNPLRAVLAPGPVPRVALSFDDGVTDEEITGAEAIGFDVAELRLDRFASTASDHVLAQVRRFSRRFPTLVTIRSAAEGGAWSGPESTRATLFEAVVPHAHGIDVELGSADAMATVLQAVVAAGAVLVVSHHDFGSTPGRDVLDSIVRDGRELGADLVKVAVMTHSAEDVRTLAAFTLDHAAAGVIVIGMGAHGTASRVFFPLLGSRLTYTDRTRPFAGQLTHRRTVELLRCFYPALGERGPDGPGSDDIA